MSSHFFTSRKQPSTANNSRFNFPNFDFSQIPIPNIRVPNLSETFSTAPDSFNRFMSPLRANERRNGGRGSTAYCDSCETKFNIFTKRKKTCLDCAMDFCTDCFIRESPSTRCGRCKKCFIFSRFPPDRSSLMTLRVRDLRWYLAQRRIPARYCKEKTDLVELIIQSSSNNGEQRSPNNEQIPSAPAGAETEADGSTGSSTDSNWVFVNNFGSDDQAAAASSEASASMTTQYNINAGDCDNVQTQAKTATTSTTTTTNLADETASTSSQISNNENQLFNICDLKCESDVNALSVRQMKLLLTRNFVDYKGCCEKEELLAKTLRLWRDHKQQEDPESIKDENLCKICMEAEINCVLLECGHMVTCNNCGKKLNECPICRQYVVRVIRTFKS